MPEPITTDLAYAAGIIDGEGCIYMSHLAPNQAKRKATLFSTAVTVSMTDFEVPYWLEATFGGSVYYQQHPNPRSKLVATWRIQGQPAAVFCAAIAPYLKVKHRQAELLLALYGDSRILFKKGRVVPAEELALRAEYVKRMKDLNARVPSA